MWEKGNTNQSSSLELNDHLEQEAGRLSGKPKPWQGGKSVIRSFQLCHLNMTFITPDQIMVLNQKQA